MPKNKISEYSATNSANTDIGGINIDEGCAPSGINNAIREVMVQLKNFQTGASGDAFTFAGGVLISGTTNTISGAAVISGNINSSGSANTFSGGVVHSGTNTFSSSVIISGNINSSGTNTFSSSQVISGNINSSGTNTFSGTTVMSGANTISHAAGTVSLPSITVNGDTNTGIFFPAADTIAASTGGSERMRIDSSGNVGINFTPSAWRTDTGNVRAIQFESSSIWQFRTTGSGEINIGNNYYYGASGTRYYINTGETTNYRQGDGTHIWYNAASGTGGNSFNFTERMRIDSSGNVGIGVTPSAWFSTVKSLDITSVGSIWANGSNTTGVAHNTYIDSGTNYAYKTSSFASSYSQYNGQHLWLSAPSGTAGNTFVFTQVLAVEKDKSLALQGATPQSGTGITFPATQSASSDANTLDDYEEGTFDVTVTMGTSGTCTLSSTYNKMKYTKIGRMVTIQGQILVDSVSSPVGEMRLSLPFAIAAADEGASLSGCVPRLYNVTKPASGIYPYVFIQNGNAYMEMEWVVDNSATIFHVPAAGDYFIINFSYFV